MTYNEVETFAGSSITATTDVSSVTGTASYEGGAVGVYVHAMVSADGKRASATSGHFKADASLTAYFGGNDVAVNKQNSLTGTIDNFELSGGEANTWEVTLQGAITAASASVDAAATNTAKGGGVGDGSFTAQFHGPNQDADTNPIAPHTVVGEFNSNFTNGSVAGAFGARLEEE